MKKYLFTAILLIAVVASGFLIFNFIQQLDFGPRDSQNRGERIVIQSAVYNPTQNSISVTAKSMNELSGNVTLNNIIIRNQTGSTIINIPISDKLNVLEFTTLRFNLNSTLSSGIYSATLATTKGGSFVSSSFIVP